jgi:hypothetical protein
MKKPRTKTAPKIRLPLPKKPGGPMTTPKGDKGYDRKREREELEFEIESEDGEKGEC